MGKWADFLVTGVKYDEGHERIIEVQTRVDKGDTVGADVRKVARLDVVQGIASGTTFVTAYLREGQWHRGEVISVVVVHGNRFIRTDSNATEKDNLGALPEYA